jgi:molybdopterin converting factor small subunit
LVFSAISAFSAVKDFVFDFVSMNIIVQIPSALRRHTGGTAKLTCAVANLNELFSTLDEQFPALKPHLRDEAGQIRRFLNVYVNEEDIRFLGGPSYAFKDGDEVLLVPSIAGGCSRSFAT